MPEPMPLSEFLARPVAEPDGVAAVAGAVHPVLGALPVDAAQFGAVRYDAPAEYRVRELRGSRMRSVASLFDEFAAAFQFPYYFAPNKDSFDECLRDLDDFVGDGPGYVAVVRDAAQLLADQLAERTWFRDAMTDCADYWARREVAFRVVLQGEAGPLDVVPLVA